MSFQWVKGNVVHTRVIHNTYYGRSVHLARILSSFTGEVWGYAFDGVDIIDIKELNYLPRVLEMNREFAYLSHTQDSAVR